MRALGLLLALALTGCRTVTEKEWAALLDPDGDGVPFPDDCDNGDPLAGGEERWYDGVDGDCADDSDYDADGDGYDDDDYGGADCDDADAAVSPAAQELCDLLDNDCDGAIDDDDASTAFPTWHVDSDGDGFGNPEFSSQGTSCTPPEGFVVDDTDCDDADESVYPGADERCDEVDQDCDGESMDDDAIDAPEWCADADGDAYGDPDAEPLRACTVPAGATASDTETCSDCDDTDASVRPGAEEIWYDDVDQDCAGDSDHDADGDAYDTIASGGEDCDDADGQIRPNAMELCNRIDDDCDGDIDEGYEGGALRTWYIDADGDGWGDPSTGVDYCEGTEPAGTVANDGDCDDADASVNPRATEVCDGGTDEDCDGLSDADDPDASGVSTFYVDADLDGYGDTTTELACALSAGLSLTGDDCDDADSGDHPGASETIGNGDDEDCDGVELCYDDDDDDGYLDTSGDARSSTDTDCSDTNEGTDTDPTADCDDADSGDHPGATETTGNGDDEDCDGVELCYDDDDDDGYLDATGDTLSSADTDCTDPSEGSNTSPTTDCDDADSGDHPGATEIVGNGDDEDCDGVEVCYHDDDDDGYLDATGDTLSSTDTDCSDAYEGSNADPTTDCDDGDAGANPGAAEVCDDRDADQDCDGLADDEDSAPVGVGTWYPDADGDGYGDGASPTEACDAPSGYLPNEGDCDDSDDTRNPGEHEDCDGVDQDCDGVVDGGAGCPCDQDWYAERSYLFCTSEESWSNAQSTCKIVGYNLVTIDDSAENTWLADEAIAIVDTRWWLGYNDRSTEGTWDWVDGSAPSYESWTSGEPDDNLGADCAAINRYSAYTWSDEDCLDKIPYICESP